MSIPSYRRVRLAAVLCVACLACAPRQLAAGDWPQLGRDAGHCNYTPDELPSGPTLLWSRQVHEPRPAWPASQKHLRFDETPQPVAAGGLLFVPSTVADSVSAYETGTGRLRWRFFTDGPVRLAAAVSGRRVYFGSDDGHLYCVNAGDGRLIWRYAAAAVDRKVVGNERVISTWPIRGGPVVLDGKVFITAGVWPFMGIFAHAVDASTGRGVWVNSGSGTLFREQPHRGASAFAGFVPRGQLAATEHGVVAPGGRTLPGCYDNKGGRLRYFAFGERASAGSHAAAMGRLFFMDGTAYRIADGKRLGSIDPKRTGAPAWAVHTEAASYGLNAARGVLIATPARLREPPPRAKRRQAAPGGAAQADAPLPPDGPWSLPAPGAPGKLFLKAGRRFYAGGKGKVAALEVNLTERRVEVAWQANVEGDVGAMLAADGKLFAVTSQGAIYCFGAGRGAPKTYGDISKRRPEVRPSRPPAARHTALAREILAAAGSPGGYAVIFGLGDGELAAALARASDLRVVAVEPDAKKVAAFRNRMAGAALYGARVTAHAGEPRTYHLPPYMAELVVVRDIDLDVGLVEKVFRILRPYGGTAYFAAPAGEVERLAAQAGLAAATVKPMGDASLLVRPGAPAGAADWTHQYADAGNTVCSADDRVRLPLGLLWFGGPSNDQVLPRHGHGPSPQVAAGRLVIEGLNMLRCIDIYTGRKLWQRDLAGLGRYYNNVSHQPGANAIGSNYVTLADSVYVVHGRNVLRLDAAGGRTVATFTLAAGPDGKPSQPGYIGAWQDVLVLTAETVSYGRGGPVRPNVRYGVASRRLLALDRRTGKELWRREAGHSFRHNNIALGAGKVFCIDGRPRDPAAGQAKLLALDIRTGGEAWTIDEGVFGSFLGYSVEHDILLEAGSESRDRAKDEVRRGMRAVRGADGKVLWTNDGFYSGPCIINGDAVITQINKQHAWSAPAWSLLTGKPLLRKTPLTGKPWHWRYWRYYGCNTASAGRHMVLFRSGAAGFTDWTGDGGTGNFGGFKSGCTSNMIPAGGVLTIPEYTRTCICHYQNQTSLALVHDPGAEMWTFNCVPWDGSAIRRLGVNLGAVGDRRAAGGTLWLEFPFYPSPSPAIQAALEPQQTYTYRVHSSYVAKADEAALPWVAASCITRLEALKVWVCKDEQPAERAYTVRLHFMEPAGLEPGKRIFDVAIQGRKVLSKFDVAAAAGGANRAIVREFKSVKARDVLTISFTPVGSDSPGATLSGVEIVAEGR